MILKSQKYLNYSSHQCRCGKGKKFYPYCILKEGKSEMIKYLSLFSGIGAFEKALTNQEIPFELVGFSEFDKYATKSYCAIHNVPESLNYGDITKINEKELPSDIDLITYGFPCQDISLAGKQKGLFNEDGTQTRSGLFFDALRIITHTQPKVAIAENVKNLTSKKFKEQFEIVLSSLEEAGYNNYYKILNAKDFGIPQNRERVFIVSIRKDVDNGKFKFPEAFPLELRLKDMLEDEVDEKFYIDNIKLDTLMQNLNCKELNKNNKTPMRLGNVYGEQFGTGFGGNVWGVYGVAPTLKTTSAASQQFVVVNNGNGDKSQVVLEDKAKLLKVGNTNPSGNGMNGCVYDSEAGLAPTITTNKGEGNKILVREATKKGYAEAHEGDGINLEQPNSKTRRGRVGHGVAQTLTTSPQQVTVQNLRIRKLTPTECFRLMGFDDEDFTKAEKVNSNTQLYKQAGNSIVVDVAEEILCMMFDEDGNFFI